jgi:hypothetical protein
MALHFRGLHLPIYTAPARAKELHRPSPDIPCLVGERLDFIQIITPYGRPVGTAFVTIALRKFLTVLICFPK